MLLLSTATALVAGTANIAVVDDTLEIDAPAGGAVVKASLFVEGGITAMAGIDKVDVLQTLAKCAADTENNAQSIQVQFWFVQL